MVGDFFHFIIRERNMSSIIFELCPYILMVRRVCKEDDKACYCYPPKGSLSGRMPPEASLKFRGLASEHRVFSPSDLLHVGGFLGTLEAFTIDGVLWTCASAIRIAGVLLSADWK